MRYAKQIAVPQFGEDSQRALAETTVAMVGCGALGSLQAELLARMGVGGLRIADGDSVSLGNLHRQILFTERDAAAGTPKVAAAAARLPAVNSGVRLYTLNERVTRANIARFVGDAGAVLDATDSTDARFLVNDFCVSRGLPWIYCGVAGTAGLVLPVLPGGPCLRCLYPAPLADSEAANCLSAGILPMTVAMAVSLQVTQLVRVLNGSAAPGTLIRLDVWDASVRTVKVGRDPACPCCGQRRFEFLGDASAQNAAEKQMD